MRQIVLDTETTGLEVERGHRIIEIGCIELLNRRPTGRHFHRYLNPERDIEAGARAVHGLTRTRLEQEPKFAEIASELLQFIEGSELIIHNAVFDIAFLEREFASLAMPEPILLRNLCQILDTLSLARERHPGQRNSLDALCKRYGIDNSHRELHGALLDARLLALDESARERAAARASAAPAMVRPSEPLPVIRASAEECAAHAQLQALLAQSSGGRCVWSALEAAASAAAGTPSERAV